MAQIFVRTWSGGLKNLIIWTKSEFLAALTHQYNILGEICSVQC